jgi:hypothetical protein
MGALLRMVYGLSSRVFIAFHEDMWSAIKSKTEIWMLSPAVMVIDLGWKFSLPTYVEAVDVAIVVTSTAKAETAK